MRPFPAGHCRNDKVVFKFIRKVSEPQLEHIGYERDFFNPVVHGSTTKNAAYTRSEVPL